MKFKKTKRNSHGSTIEYLPSDLLIEVLTRVATSSFTDLFNAKLSCRNFLEASDDKFIMKNISIEKFPAIPWWQVKDEVSSFLKACKESGNPEALYRQGMMEFFSWKKVESGEEYLKRALEMEHMEASYVYGIILLCKGGESNEEQGMKLLNAVKKSRKLGECRKKTKAFILSMWIRNPIVKCQELVNHHAKTCGRRNNGGIGGKRGWWQWIDDREDNEDKDVEEVNYCEGCMWEDEVSLFCKLFR
ncbi:hypothetical protein VitviT2T_001403 [Vitis vinifera]|uniref:At2g35280-like TPR domain-containing protein n=2 Tax=Vitis vinifera TaxID=29760 RepID=A0ABY9BFK3_VITVI|nr:hypothetical protein VitviT2T_001403 [Vitis vinifera]